MQLNNPTSTKKMETNNMTTPHSRKSIDPSPVRRALRFGALALILACCALPTESRALLPPPPPDGGYPNFNTAEGTDALFNLTTGSGNTAIGFSALSSNTSGICNTATGAGALFSNTSSGHNNTATGFQALFSNTTGAENTANGLAALFSNTTGRDNTATGVSANRSNTTGSFNTADGYRALRSNTTGNNNTALGHNAGVNLTTGDSNIDIGAFGVAGESRTIRIGEKGFHTRTFVAGISGSPITGTIVVVDSAGRLGTVASSRRLKDDIKPMDRASEAILALRPVTFHYKKEVDPEGIPQFGLVAEDVEKVNRDLVVRDTEGKPYTVRYEAVNAMLLNEFLKEHRRVEEQQATITELKSTVAQQQKHFQATAAHQQEQIEALTAGLQKVSAQVEMNRAATQMAVNDQ
jgi:trimeric autotransporter adhesin